MPRLIPPKFAYSVHTNAASFTSHVATGAVSALTLDGSNVTIEGWLLIDSIVITQNSNTVLRVFTVGTYPNGLLVVYNALSGVFTIFYGTRNTSSNFRIPVNQWFHIAVVVDNASAKFEIYINGQSTNDYLFSGSGALGSLSGSDFRVGGENPVATIKCARARLYKRKLSAAEILSSFQHDKANSNCLVEWKFTEGTGTTVADTSGNGRTGTFTSNPTWSNDVPFAPRGTTQNFVLQSEDMTSATWLKSNITITSGHTDPLGGATAFALVEDTANTFKSTYQTVSTTNGTITWSVYVKSAGRSWIALVVGGGASYTWFNLSTGAAGATSGVLHWNPTIESIGNGWYRLSVTTNHPLVQIFCASANSTSGYTGNGLASVYVWRPQVTKANVPQIYVPTTTKAELYAPATPNLTRGVTQNLALQSNDFTNASWAKTNSTVTQASLQGPVSSTVNLLTETAVTNAHYASQTAGTSLVGLDARVSIYAKKGVGRDWICLGPNGANSAVWFNINAGTIGSKSAVYSATIENVGDGWFRCSVIYRMSQGSTLVYITDANANNTTVGSTSNYVYIQGYQVSAPAFPTNYIETTSTAITTGPEASNRNNLPSMRKFDYAVAITSPSASPIRTATNATLAIGTSDVTLEGWVRIDKVDVTNARIWGVGAYPNGFMILANGLTQQIVGHYETLSPTSGPEYPYGQWFHLAGSIENATRLYRIYINGVLRAVSTIPGSGSLPSLTGNLVGLGGDAVNAACHTARLRYYKRRLADNEVMDAYVYDTKHNNCLVEWKFTDGAGVITDTSGNGFNGTLTSGTSWVTEAPIQARGATQNLILQSNNPASATWTKTNATATQNGDWWTITDTSAAATGFVQISYTNSVPGREYVWSFELKKTVGYTNEVRLQFWAGAVTYQMKVDPNTGILTNVAGNITGYSVDYGTYFKVYMTAMMSGVPTSALCILYPCIDSVSAVTSVDIRKFQLREANRPDYYVETAATAIVNGDVVSNV